MKGSLMRLGMALIAFNAEGTGGGDGGAPAAPLTPENAPRMGASDTTPTAPAAAENADAVDQPKSGDDPAKKSEGTGDPAPNGDDKATGDPEATASFEVSAPEGMEAHADAFAGYTGAAQSFLKDNPNATAADALKWAAEYQTDQIKTQTTAMQDQFQAVVDGWADQARADQEIGGDKFDASVASAISALDKFGTPELRAYLEESGAGSHPEVIRALSKVGKMVQETPVLGGGTGGAGAQSFTSDMFGKKG